MIVHHCTFFKYFFLIWTFQTALCSGCVLAAQNTAYVMLQIYLFIVCSHATEPNVPSFFFSLDPKLGKEKEGNVKNKSDRCRCHAEPEGDAAKNVAPRSVTPAGLGLKAASPLSPPQD